VSLDQGIILDLALDSLARVPACLDIEELAFVGCSLSGAIVEVAGEVTVGCVVMVVIHEECRLGSVVGTVEAAQENTFESAVHIHNFLLGHSSLIRSRAQRTLPFDPISSGLEAYPSWEIVQLDSADVVVASKIVRPSYAVVLDGISLAAESRSATNGVTAKLGSKEGHHSYLLAGLHSKQALHGPASTDAE
jgi:hypothetical protein